MLWFLSCEETLWFQIFIDKSYWMQPCLMPQSQTIKLTWRCFSSMQMRKQNAKQNQTYTSSNVRYASYDDVLVCHPHMHAQNMNRHAHLDTLSYTNTRTHTLTVQCCGVTHWVICFSLPKVLIFKSNLANMLLSGPIHDHQQTQPTLSH